MSISRWQLALFISESRTKVSVLISFDVLCVTLLVFFNNVRDVRRRVSKFIKEYNMFLQRHWCPLSVLIIMMCSVFLYMSLI